MTTRILIDNSLDDGAESYLFENARAEIRADTADEALEAIAAVAKALNDGLWAAGYFSYELGYLLEPRLAPLLTAKRTQPLMQFGLFDAPDIQSPGQADALLKSWTRGDYRTTPPTLSMSRATYQERFSRLKDYIAAGDIYQLNLTLKGRFAMEGCPVALYRDLRRKQPVSYGALMQFPEFTILSHSPELFLHIGDGEIATRPMKGTAARGKTLEEDRATREWLSADEKSRAENLMIADLMRNDIGRVAETGTVAVTDLFSVETYRTLHQMTSGVSARLRQGTTLEELLRSLFPPGSIIGAPKVRAMEIIRELEAEARGVYTGAVGMIAPGGAARFNVAIRTLVLDREGVGEIGIGSGIVYDSACETEYEECLLKMRFLTDPVQEFDLIETLRFDAGSGYYLLAHHLERLAASAEYFGYPFDRTTVEAALSAKASDCSADSLRVRLLLSRDGSLSLTAVPMTLADPVQPYYFVISEQITDSENVFLYHKTTIRELYDGEYQTASEQLGADEVLFVNERGELTEGSRTNIFIQRDGMLLTPPLTSGLLPGTLRAELLASGKVREEVLTVDDLRLAEGIYLGNSVRGLVPASALSAGGRLATGT